MKQRETVRMSMFCPDVPPTPFGMDRNVTTRRKPKPLKKVVESSKLSLRRPERAEDQENAPPVTPRHRRLFSRPAIAEIDPAPELKLDAAPVAGLPAARPPLRPHQRQNVGQTERRAPGKGPGSEEAAVCGAEEVADRVAGLSLGATPRRPVHEPAGRQSPALRQTGTGTALQTAPADSSQRPAVTSEAQQLSTARDGVRDGDGRSDAVQRDGQGSSDSFVSAASSPIIGTATPAPKPAAPVPVTPVTPAINVPATPAAAVPAAITISSTPEASPPPPATAEQTSPAAAPASPAVAASASSDSEQSLPYFTPRRPAQRRAPVVESSDDSAVSSPVVETPAAGGGGRGGGGEAVCGGGGTLLARARQRVGGQPASASTPAPGAAPGQRLPPLDATNLPSPVLEAEATPSEVQEVAEARGSPPSPAQVRGRCRVKDVRTGRFGRRVNSSEDDEEGMKSQVVVKSSDSSSLSATKGGRRNTDSGHKPAGSPRPCALPTARAPLPRAPLPSHAPAAAAAAAAVPSQPAAWGRGSRPLEPSFIPVRPAAAPSPAARPPAPPPGVVPTCDVARWVEESPFFAAPPADESDAIVLDSDAEWEEESELLSVSERAAAAGVGPDSGCAAPPRPRPEPEPEPEPEQGQWRQRRDGRVPEKPPRRQTARRQETQQSRGDQTPSRQERPARANTSSSEDEDQLEKFKRNFVTPRQKPRPVSSSSGDDDADFIDDGSLSGSEESSYRRAVAADSLPRSRPRPAPEIRASDESLEAAEVTPEEPIYRPPPVQARKPVDRVGRSPAPVRTLSFMSSLATHLAEGSRRHPDAVPYVRSFRSRRLELARHLFRVINAEVFESKLADDLDITFNKRMRRTAGFCYSKQSRQVPGERTARVELSEKVVDSAERLRDTLVHELCHAAAWVVSGDRAGHGAVWRGWAQRVQRRFPELPPVSRCHSYEVHCKYTYRCTGCGYSFGRHSKSLDTKRKVCGRCRGTFECVLTSQLDRPGGATPATPRAAAPFALFVKENYGSVKKESGLKHAEIMKRLGQQFAAAKISQAAAKLPATECDDF